MYSQSASEFALGDRRIVRTFACSVEHYGHSTTRCGKAASTTLPIEKPPPFGAIEFVAGRRFAELSHSPPLNAVQTHSGQRSVGIHADPIPPLLNCRFTTTLTNSLGGQVKDLILSGANQIELVCPSFTDHHGAKDCEYRDPHEPSPSFDQVTTRSDSEPYSPPDRNQ